MKFLSAQPDTDYYIWQLQVQVHNFRKYCLESDMIVLLGYIKHNGINPRAKEFANTTSAKIYFLEDSRTDTSYIPSIRPHLIKKFFISNALAEPFLYHDSDIIFLTRPDFDSITSCGCDKVWLSDTVGYIGAKYIQSKGVGLLEEMCKVVGIEPSTVIANETKSGGAQYLFARALDFSFWDKVENDCTDLYQAMQGTRTKYSPDHPIQSWTSDMWALLYNLWLVGKNTVVEPKLKFAWVTDPISSTGDTWILHNAGVTPDRNELFYKGNYLHRSPFTDEHEYVSPKFSSWLYVQEIKETAKNQHS